MWEWVFIELLIGCFIDLTVRFCFIVVVLLISAVFWDRFLRMIRKRY